MKKLLLGSLSLCLFSLSVTIFQMSCKKDAIAQAGTTSTITQEGKLIVFGQDRVIATENYDGSGYTKLNLTLPAGYVFSNAIELHLSPDHKTIFFTCTDSNIQLSYGFACNIDGSNVRKIDANYTHVAY
jgi:sugar lactone lactonase YvrE